MKNINKPADKVDKMILAYIILISVSVLYFGGHIAWWIIRETLL